MADLKGEWRDIIQNSYLKGYRRNPKYFPVIGETCRMSGPNADDADGFTWLTVEVLWRDDLFIVTRKEGCWPTVTKLELALFEPLPVDPLYDALFAVVELGRYDTREQTELLRGELAKRGLKIVEAEQ